MGLGGTGQDDFFASNSLRVTVMSEPAPKKPHTARSAMAISRDLGPGEVPPSQGLAVHGPASYRVLRMNDDVASAEALFPERAGSESGNEVCV